MNCLLNKYAVQLDILNNNHPRKKWSHLADAHWLIAGRESGMLLLSGRRLNPGTLHPDAYIGQGMSWLPLAWELVIADRCAGLERRGAEAIYVTTS